MNSPKHVRTLLDSVKSMWQKGQLTDITLLCGNQTFQAHRVVLGAYSEHLLVVMLSSHHTGLENMVLDMDQYEIPPEILDSLLNFMYTGLLVVNVESRSQLIAAADTLDIQHLPDLVKQASLCEVSPGSPLSSLDESPISPLSRQEQMKHEASEPTLGYSNLTTSELSNIPVHDARNDDYVPDLSDLARSMVQESNNMVSKLSGGMQRTKTDGFLIFSSVPVGKDSKRSPNEIKRSRGITATKSSPNRTDLYTTKCIKTQTVLCRSETSQIQESK